MLRNQDCLSQPIFIHPATMTRPTSRNNNFETGSSTCECANSVTNLAVLIAACLGAGILYG